MSSKQAVKERKAKVAALRAQQQRRERRRTVLVIGAAVTASLVLIGVVAIVVIREANRQQVAAAVEAPIEGVQEFPNLARSHVQGVVKYKQDPPVGGAHDGVWTNCGVYTTQVSAEQSVHSMEHGAVWLTYRPDLPAEQVEALGALAAGKEYALVSPHRGLSSPVVASAWGLQLKVDSVDDPRLQKFFTKYMQGKQTPEPGAACFGGTGKP